MQCATTSSLADRLMYVNYVFLLNGMSDVLSVECSCGASVSDVIIQADVSTYNVTTVKFTMFSKQSLLAVYL